MRIGIVYSIHTLYIHTVDIAGRSLLQNLTGDCWLLAAIAGVAEFPGYFKDHVFVTQASQSVARLFDVDCQIHLYCST